MSDHPSLVCFPILCEVTIIVTTFLENKACDHLMAILVGFEQWAPPSPRQMTCDSAILPTPMAKHLPIWSFKRVSCTLMHNNAIKYGFGALSVAVKISSSSSVKVVQCLTTQMLNLSQESTWVESLLCFLRFYNFPILLLLSFLCIGNIQMHLSSLCQFLSLSICLTKDRERYETTDCARKEN